MFLRKHWATLALLAFAAVYLLGALQLGVKARPITESGFVPSLLGVLLLALCGWELLRPYFRPAKGEAEGEAPVAEGKLSSCAVILLGSVLSFEWLGFPATAIPVLTRGLMFTAARLQLAILKGPGHLAPVGWTFYLSIGLFLTVFALSLLGRRFRCRYVCPSGALFSVGNLLRIGQRQVADTCISCQRSLDICPFDAIQEDYTTRTADCTFCQTCGGVCPPGAIQFVTRFHTEGLKPEGEPPGHPRAFSRRAFVATAAAAAGTPALVRIPAASPGGDLAKPLRPPGSVPEELFQDLCIRYSKGGLAS